MLADSDPSAIASREHIIQPVKHSLMEERSRQHRTMIASTFLSQKSNPRFRTGQRRLNSGSRLSNVVVFLLW
ncbi:hypothetical protein [Synechococcus elongatus]|uniref:hypothetical protein n=1 Tax=Synechococcus elongatus TaxID=32046 RepID=UPI0030D28173